MVTDEDKEAIRKFKDALQAFNDATNGLSAQRIQVSFLDVHDIGKVNRTLMIGNLRRYEDFRLARGVDMANTIWKAVLEQKDVQEIDVPENATLITAREQNNELCVWFICNPDYPMTKRKIAIVGTGHPVPDASRYIGSGHLLDGCLVFHVFEL